MADMEVAEDHMRGFEVGARALWQPTYYDTLARYYSYRAFLSPDEETWKVLMDTAETYVTDAKAAAKDNPAVREFGIYFVLTKNKGFGGSRAPQSDVKDGAARNAVP
jgi:hypothetical protein